MYTSIKRIINIINNCIYQLQGNKVIDVRSVTTKLQTKTSEQQAHLCSHSELNYTHQHNHNQEEEVDEFKLDNVQATESSCSRQIDATNSFSFPTTATGPLPFEAIPGPKPSLPFIGTSWIYTVGRYKSKKLHQANLDKYQTYGRIMKEEFQFGRPSVTVFHPEDFKAIFAREGTCPSRPVLPYVIRHRLSDPSRYPNIGLANMMGEEWSKLRSELAPVLLSKELKKRHIGSQNRVSTRLVNYIKNLLPVTDKNTAVGDEYKNHIERIASETHESEGGVVPNIQEVFYRFSMESIINLCINQELGCLNATGGDSFNAAISDGELIFQAAKNFFEAQHKLYYGPSWWKYFNTKPYKLLCESQDAIHDIASKYIDVALIGLRRKRELHPQERQHWDEPDSLIETLYSQNKFSDLEIKSTIVDFIGGGIYTVANTLTMALFLLASNPSVQEQLYQEICQVFKDETEIGSDINIDMEKLEQLKFLKHCLKESYRLLPTIPGIARTLQKDTVLSNYIVPEGTLVFCNFMVTCRLPQYFEDPDSYNPNRWERTGKIKGDLAYSLLPFGHGVRKCIGHNFAELEIYVALAKLIRSFKVRTMHNQDIKTLDLSYKFIVVPEKPVSLSFTPREVCKSH